MLIGLSIFADLILLASCINFANLSLAQVLQRSKEVGIRKTLGANRGDIVIQFLFESLLLTILALIITFPLVYFALPVYTSLTNTLFTFSDIFQTKLIIQLLLFVITIGLISGLLPALALSRFQIANIIQGINLKSALSHYLRPLTTVLQFTFSTSLIILAIAISLQINHLRTMDVGFNKNNLVILDSTFTEETADEFNYTAMINELNQHPGIASVASSNSRPTNANETEAWVLPGFGPNEFVAAGHYIIDVNYLETVQFELLAGRNFSENFPSDFMNLSRQQQTSPDVPLVHGAILARTGVIEFGLGSPEEALGKLFWDINSDSDTQYQVIGVIEDFHLAGGLEGTLDQIRVLRASLDPLRTILIRIEPAQMTDALNHIDSVWQTLRPDIPIDRTFYEQTFSNIVNENTEGISVASIFASIITVLISAFGLFALAFYASERRTKEIGVRKVLGATPISIIKLLTWDFFNPVWIACVIASVIGFFAIQRYLQQFSSQVEISTLLYVGVTLGTIIVAGLSVSSQSYRCANTDPNLSLRYE